MSAINDLISGGVAVATPTTKPSGGSAIASLLSGAASKPVPAPTVQVANPNVPVPTKLSPFNPKNPVNAEFNTQLDLKSKPTSFISSLLSPSTYSSANIKSTIKNTPVLNGQQTPLAKGLDATLNSTVGERLGAVGRSIKTGSLQPLKQSFEEQSKQFALGQQPGETKQDYIDRVSNTALMLTGEMENTGKFANPEVAKNIKVNNYQGEQFANPEVAKNLDVAKKTSNQISTEAPEPLSPLTQEATKYKSAEEFVNKFVNNPEKIPVSKGYNESVAQQSSMLKQADEVLAERRKIEKMAQSSEGQAMSEAEKANIFKKYQALVAEREKLLSQATLMKHPETLVKTHIGEKELKNQLTDIWNKATNDVSLRTQQQQQIGSISPKQSPLAAEQTTAIPSENPIQNTLEKPPLQESPQRTPNVSSKNSFEPSVNANNKYVKNEPIDISIGKNDQTTAKDLREKFTGVKNSQIVRGSQLADEIKNAVPNKLERQGMFWNKAANGDENVLRQMATDPKLEIYKPEIEKALDLSLVAKENLDKVTQYYNEAGAVSKELETIKGIVENYQNRIYKPEPPKDFVSTEFKQNLKQTTSHAKARVFDTEFQAAQAGKKFATTDVADALSIHNEEMARVNTSRQLAQTMADNGLGQWTKEGKVPADYSKVGGIKKGQESFVAPKNIAKGLEAIADPDFTQKIDSLRGIGKYQGIVKTVDLSYSLFHHLTMAAQTLAQGGWDAISSLPKMSKVLESSEFGQLEQDFTKHTGMTAKVEANQDVLRNLLGGEKGLADKPVIKQFLAGTSKSAEFLFGKLQRFLKVMDYGEKISNWAAKNPEATNAEVKAFKTGIAKEINSAYGGLNWEAMGMTKSNVSLLRKVLLAPDWTVSNIEQAKMALGKEGAPAAKAAWGNYARAIVGGMLITEAMSKLMTGHFTNQNPTGHKLELQVAPNVYVSLIRGGPGDLVKLFSNIQESGLSGVSRFGQGKLSPFLRTAIEGLSGVDYAGRNIYSGNTPLEKTKSGLSNLASSVLPIPIGGSTTYKYISDNLKQGTPISPTGLGAIATGLGRYSKNSEFNSAIQDTKSARAGARVGMNGIYDKVQTLLKAGKTDEAQKIVDGFSDEDYKAYKQIKTAAKATATLKAEPKMFNTVKQVHDLMQQGNQAEAQAIIDNMTDEDYRIYKLTKSKAGY